ncbi:MAG: N-acetyltransferase [Chitinophagaceae bacterium]|nr:MAG: N-acetyltransferase [Chitinophagaceae bacterium]
MTQVEFKLDTDKRGSFLIAGEHEPLAEMEVSIADDTLTVYHTEVAPEAEGKGLAKMLLSAMVEHARDNKLKVSPLCSYVQVQFRRHPDEYADIWQPHST